MVKIPDFVRKKVQDKIKDEVKDRTLNPNGGNVQQGLVPIKIPLTNGKQLPTGFYITPGEPADPRDCDRWPNSPWCGGVPTDLKPNGLTPEAVRDECNIGIQFTPSLGFITAPPIQIVYRYPECRGEPPPPPEDVEVNDTEYYNPDSPEFKAIPPGTLCLFYYGFSSLVENNRAEEYGGISYSTQSQSITYLEMIPPEEATELETPLGTIFLKGVFTKIYSNAIYTNREEYESDANALSPPYDAWVEMTQPWNGTTTTNGQLYSRPFGSQNLKLDVRNEETTGQAAIITNFNSSVNEGFYLKSIEWIKEQNWLKQKKTITSGEGQRYTTTATEKYKFWIAEYLFTDTYATNSLNPPPPEPCMPCCCNSSSPQSDQLLKLILQRIGTPTNAYIYDNDPNKRDQQYTYTKLDTLFNAAKTNVDRTEITNRIIGIEEFPASVPESLISKDEGLIGNLIPNPNIEVRNLTAFLGWYIKRFDELMGQFEIPIEIKDSDPTKPGDQPKGIRLPNVAESIGEMMSLMIQTSMNSEMIVHLCTKALVEAGQLKVQGAKNYALTDAIVEYLAFETQEVKTNLPLSFTPGKEDFADLLKEEEIEIKTVEAVDIKKKNFQLIMQELLHAAAITRALNFRPLKKNEDMKEQIKKLIKKAGGVIDELDKGVKDENGKTSWDRFLEDAEIGFTNKTGITTDTTQPYGNPYDERPKIIEIGKNEGSN